MLPCFAGGMIGSLDRLRAAEMAGELLISTGTGGTGACVVGTDQYVPWPPLSPVHKMQSLIQNLTA